MVIKQSYLALNVEEYVFYLVFFYIFHTLCEWETANTAASRLVLFDFQVIFHINPPYFLQKNCPKKSGTKVINEENWNRGGMFI